MKETENGQMLAGLNFNPRILRKIRLLIPESRIKTGNF